MYATRKPTIVITNPHAARAFTILFGLVFLGSALFTSSLAYEQMFVYPSWPERPAAVESITNSGRRGRSVSARYTYQFEGATYNGYSQIDSRSSVTRTETEQTMMIRVNPNNPSESAVQRSYTAFLIWSVLIIPFGALLIYKGVRP